MGDAIFLYVALTLAIGGLGLFVFAFAAGAGWSSAMLVPAALGFYFALTHRKRELNATFGEYARLYKGLLTPAETTTYPSVSFPYRGMHVDLRFFPAGPPHENELFTSLTVALRGSLVRQPLRLEVAPLSELAFFATKFRGLEELPRAAHDAPLAGVHAQTNDPELLQALFAEGLAGVIHELDRMGGVAPCYISLNASRLVIQKMRFLHGLGHLREVTGATLRFVDLLLDRFGHALSADDIVVITEQTSVTEALDAPVCTICGTEILDAACVCTKCATPHHRDCWEYNQVCSTFACGSTTYVVQTGEPPGAA